MNATVVRITARGVLGRRRFLLLLPLPLLVVGLAVLSRSLDVEPTDWGPPVLVGLGLGVVLPLLALIVGAGVFGNEIDDGTLVHILAKPLPRWEIVLSKLAVAVGITAVVVAVPLYVGGVLADSARLGLGLVVAGVVGALAYCALFLALSLVTRRPVLLGLAYVLIWEGVLSNVLSGTRVLSVQQYTIAVADRIAPTRLLDAQVSMPVVVVLGAIFVAGATTLAIQRLRSFSIAGETG